MPSRNPRVLRRRAGKQKPEVRSQKKVSRPGVGISGRKKEGVNEILSKSLCLFHGYSSTLDKIEAHMNSSRSGGIGPIITLREATAPADIPGATDAHPEIDTAAHICPGQTNAGLCGCN